MIEITDKLLESSKGIDGFTKQQQSMVNRLKTVRTIHKLLGRFVEGDWWDKFNRMGEIGVPVNNKPKVKKKKKKVARSKVKGKKGKRRFRCRDEFYNSPEWRRLRYRVIRNNKGCCMACGRSQKEHGIVIHVDHIKPRSKYPELELDYNNMQLLCEDCNIGKSNIDETDWRPEDLAELEILAEARILI